MKYRGVFFDFDYTLGDSTQAIVEGYQRGFSAMGRPIPTMEQVRTAIGLTLLDGYRLLTGDKDPTHGQEFYHQFQLAVGELAAKENQRLMVEGSKLLPGAETLLVVLKELGIRTAIISTKPGTTLRKIFAFNQVDHLVDLIIGGKDVSHYKPDPEGLCVAMTQLGLAAEQVLFCGDTIIDAETAQRAGVDFCAVLNGTTPQEAFRDFPHAYIAQDLSDLQVWLDL